MPSLSERRTHHFYDWEALGRGNLLFPQSVHLEPEFFPFFPLVSESTKDDGRGYVFGSNLIRSVKTLFGTPKKELSTYSEGVYPKRAYAREDNEKVAEFKIHINKEIPFKREALEHFLLLASQLGTVSFEIKGIKGDISLVLTCREQHVQSFKFYLNSFFPDVIYSVQGNSTLRRELIEPMRHTAVLDFGLSEEFIRPLNIIERPTFDPLVSIIATLENLEEQELGMLQVLIEPTVNPWSHSMLQSVSDGAGGCFFSDEPNMVKYAERKVYSSLFACIIRIVSKGNSKERSITIAKALSQALISSTKSPINSLIPLYDESYPLSELLVHVIERTSARSGMILSSDEIATLVHFPFTRIKSDTFRNDFDKEKKAPESVIGHDCVIGINSFEHQETAVSLSTKQRVRHTHIIGATGVGKSTLIKHMIVQDMRQGRGIAVLDPHGDLIEDLLAYVPKLRTTDVIIIDPSDIEYPVGLNILEAKTDIERIVLSADLVGLFKRLSTSWGDQMHSILANAILAFLESTEGGTLIDLRRFLIEKKFRKEVLETVTDENVIYYWEHEFPMLRTGSVSSILTRLDSFLRPKVIRNMMIQKEGIDFDDALASNKILLCKLSQGLIGRENSYLLGTVIAAKIQQAIQARQFYESSSRSPFFCYIDEFQNFLTPSMEEILSGARKYGLGLILAHQGLEQLYTSDRSIAESVIANAGTRICFRLGDTDSQKLEKGFSSFDANDLQNLSIGQAIIRVGSSSHDFNIRTLLLDRNEANEEIKKATKTISRFTYGKRRGDVEALYQREPITKTKKEDNPPPKEAALSEPKLPQSLPPPIELHKSVETTEEPELADYLEQQEQQREHIRIQNIIKRTGQQKGFISEIEKPTQNGDGRIDVSLVKDEMSIAVEVSITNTPEYELQNIRKCHESGYTHVICCTDDDGHRLKLKDLISSRISEKSLKSTYFFSLEEVLQFLNTFQKPSKEEKKMKGYRIQVRYKENSQQEMVRRKDIVEEILKQSIRKDDGFDKK